MVIDGEIRAGTGLAIALLCAASITSCGPRQSHCHPTEANITVDGGLWRLKTEGLRIATDEGILSKLGDPCSAPERQTTDYLMIEMEDHPGRPQVLVSDGVTGLTAPDAVHGAKTGEYVFSGEVYEKYESDFLITFFPKDRPASPGLPVMIGCLKSRLRSVSGEDRGRKCDLNYHTLPGTRIKAVFVSSGSDFEDVDQVVRAVGDLISRSYIPPTSSAER